MVIGPDRQHRVVVLIGPLRQAGTDDLEPEIGTTSELIVQMLDRAGVATLLRLLFMPQPGSSRDVFYKILGGALARQTQCQTDVCTLRMW